MTALALPAALLPARRPGVELLQWLSPAPLWSGTGRPAEQPWIAELTSDRFVPEFLQLVGGPGASAGDLANTEPPHLGGDADAPLRLFQPLSQRYYLVTASLVCRRPGIPDHRVQPALRERTSFVLRRLAGDGVEQAWLPAVGSSASGAVAAGAPAGGIWVDAVPDRVTPGEEQLPMHPAPVAGFGAAGSTAAVLGMALGQPSTRTVFYGYIPVARRERQVETLTDEQAAALLQAAQDQSPASEDKVPPAVTELDVRVVAPLQTLTAAGGPSIPAEQRQYASLFLLLDFGDWLSSYLPAVYEAVTQDSPTVDGTAAQAFLTALQQGSIASNGSTLTYAEAIRALVPFQALVHGADLAGPTVGYDCRAANDPKRYLSLAEDALQETGYSPTIPPELQGLLEADPVGPAATAGQQTYLIRAVYEHDPCQPVLSAASAPFVLARAVDGDAPARRIRIPLPDIGNMRQFNRGVALEMPPSLRKMMNRIRPEMMKGDPPNDPGGPELGLICSYSIQIIFLCAFIVLFVFLVLLNIVFWWLPFLKICFPVPRTPPTQPGPSP